MQATQTLRVAEIRLQDEAEYELVKAECDEAGRFVYRIDIRHVPEPGLEIGAS